MGIVNTRMQNLAEIVEILRKHGGRAKFSEIYELVAVNWGMTRSTLWSYLETLKVAGKVTYPNACFDSEEPDAEIEMVE